MQAVASIIGSESIMALTPVIIKQTPLDPITAIWTRILPTATLGYLIGSKSIATSEIGSAVALGNINLLHILSSYEAFRNLPAGQAMSLFYTYPLWILAFSPESITMREYGFIGIATIGSILLNQDPGHAKPALERTPRPHWGIFMALTAAITEAGMYTILKALGWLDASKSTWVVNASAAMWLGLVQLMSSMTDKIENPVFTGSFSDTVWLTSFHSFSTFIGYWLRFYAVPRLSSVTYSVLSYSGLVASYLFGALFLGETPGPLSLLGALLIILGGVLTQL
jgi:drug/metabolite transporter (DMT)-like permease